ncbi:MAG: acyl--CoA ligase [Fimbriimonadaceae bacterium]|nr:acyl--CoA ligase [Alphaproteobacteria bacterium]
MNRIHQLLEGWAADQPDRLVYIDHDGSSATFSQFAGAVDAAANLLRAYDVRPGDRVSLVCENCVAAAAIVLACSRVEAWVNLINARITSEEIGKIGEHAGVRVLIFTHQVSEAARLHGQHFGANEVSSCRYGRVLISTVRDVTPEPVFRSGTEQVGALIYTTGTTGDPKGVMLTHENLLAASLASMRARELSPQDNAYFILPMTHIFGFCSVFLASLRAGARLEFAPRFAPQAFIDALAKGASVAQGVPAHYAATLKHCLAHGINSLYAPNLRYCSAGGAPLDIDWKRRVETFLGTQLHNGYGMTEASPGIAATVIGRPCHDDSVGFALSGVELKLAAPPNTDKMVDGVGEILCRGPNIMKGYYKNPRTTSDVIDSDGWLHTGDLGRFGDDGSLYVVGRCKELIIRSGFNVFPIEVETAMNSHPQVVLAAVIGRRLADGNEEVLGFAELLSGASLTVEDLKTYLQDRLAPYKRPARIIFAEKLPAANTGKILKHRLIETFADQLES